MNARSTFPKPGYPRKDAIQRMLDAARAGGLDPVGFEAAPDGTIRVWEARAVPQQPKNDFDRLENDL